MRTTYLDTKLNNKCCGCTACESVCPVDAIKMVDDEEGFKYPKVDESICINCGKCKVVCPFDNITVFDSIKTYAAVNRDENVLKTSTSGGVFRALADYMIDNGGYVCGAVIENNIVFHILSNDDNEIIKMSGSKYVQSDMKNVITEIKRILNFNKVLFTGTPCQCAAVKNVFKNNDNLIVMDFVCHGVPSSAVFNDYINYLETINGESVNYFKFRNKTANDCGLYDVYKTNSGNVVIKPFYDSYYLSGFQMALFTRECCNTCPYARIQRCSDITVCDYWGFEKYHNEFDTSKGVSGLIVNTDNGKKILEDIQGKLDLITTKIDELANENANLLISTPKNPNRDDYYKRRKNEEFITLAHEYMNFPGRLTLKIKAIVPKKIKNILKKAIKGIKR